MKPKRQSVLSFSESSLVGCRIPSEPASKETDEYRCKVDACSYSTNKKPRLVAHYDEKHKIEFLFKCNVRGCSYTSKKKSSIEEHRAAKHHLNVTWYKCDAVGCAYKAKRKRSIKTHKQIYHDVGDNQCDFCANLRNSCIPFPDEVDPQQIHEICQICFKKATGKSSRVELTWSNYTDRVLGFSGLLSSDLALSKVGGCQLYRPDKLYVDKHYVEIDECDEHQHKNGEYLCEDRRISEMILEQGILGKKVLIIRWNPHTFKRNGVRQQVSEKERMRVFCALKLHLRKIHEDIPEKLHIYYMYYDKNNPTVTKAFPHSFIYSEADFPVVLPSPPGLPGHQSPV